MNLTKDAPAGVAVGLESAQVIRLSELAGNLLPIHLNAKSCTMYDSTVSKSNVRSGSAFER